MKIQLDDIKESPQELVYTEDVEELNQRLGQGTRDYRLPSGIGVAVEYHRGGLDVFFRGTVHADVVGTCARCLEDYPFPVDRGFALVLEPRAVADDEAGELSPDELARSTYEGEEIDLTPHVYEETLLALPTRPLCREECRGLCPRCGANLNADACGCPAAPSDPRFAVLATLRRGK